MSADANLTQTTELWLERREVHDFGDRLWKAFKALPGDMTENQGLLLAEELNDEERKGFQTIDESIRDPRLTQLAEWRLVELVTTVEKRLVR
jgi:hypothetical protein